MRHYQAASPAFGAVDRSLPFPKPVKSAMQVAKPSVSGEFRLMKGGDRMNTWLRTRVVQVLTRRRCSSLVLAAVLCGLCDVGMAQQAPSTASASGSVTLFQNVRIFDGKNATLSGPSHVLVRGNKIETISTQPIPVDRRADTRIIEGGGRTLMPGLIDNHWHAMLMRVTPAQAFGDVGYNNLQAGDEATDTLMRGFTTVRDVGGPVFGLKRAIDEGIVKGPRIYPSGAVITVTSGHGDFRQLTDLPRTIGGMLTRMEQIGGSMVADSPDEVRVRVREQLMQGASQIKLTAGGGVSSPFSPIDVTTFTEAELRAAVEAAENWGTYVAAHAFTPAAIQRVHCGRREVYRTRHADGRSNRPTDRREGHLAEYAAAPRGLEAGLSGGFGPASQGG